MDRSLALEEDEERAVLIASRKEMRVDQAKRRDESAAKRRAENVPLAVMLSAEARAESLRS